MSASVSNGGEKTLFLVVRITSLGTQQAICGGPDGYQLGLTPDGRVTAAVTSQGWLLQDGGASALALSTWYVLGFASNASNSTTVYVDGREDGRSSAVLAASATTMTLGSNHVGEYFDGCIAEAVTYDRVLSDSEFRQVNSYLTAKYRPSIYRDFDMDSSEAQALGHHSSGFAVGSGHQHAWIASPTRRGMGHAERVEVHDNSTTDSAVANMRALMSVYDTNEGGFAHGLVTGYPDVYWAWSSYLPTSGAGDTNATVMPGFSQITTPDYEHLIEIHERGNLEDLDEVSNHAIMIRNNQLQLRTRCGQFTWRGSKWIRPAWNVGVPGTNGSNDQIPIPIVKAGGIDAVIITDVWIDIIWHIKFAPDSSGLVEVWSRQAGELFTEAPNLRTIGPTHKVLVGPGSKVRTSADLEVQNGVTGSYLEIGLYTGSPSWTDRANGAHVHIFDDLRRYGSLAEAKNNWGGS